jgi:cyclopropane-fatty-acyl-phospholipid synthase
MSMLLTEQPGPARMEPAAARPIAASARLGLLDRAMAAVVQRMLVPVDLRLVLWNGESQFPASKTAAGDLVVRTRSALAGLAVNPELYFGEAYMRGALEVSGDFLGVLERLNRINDPSSPRSSSLLRFVPRNGMRRARHNVHHHYDIGNEFYALWLDSELLYTCAYFPRPECTLEDAQVAKMDLVCRKLRLQPGEDVVEAGCGWGALALHMARQYGVRVRAFNLSTEQVRYARERAAREGLAGRVEFVQDDYRNISGTYDAFVSVGMLEHVGPRDYATVGALIRRVLRPSTGRGLLHFIGRDRPRPLNAWIRRRIFPGGYPPTLREVTAAIMEPAGLSIVDVENLRLHYARTLEHWFSRFESAEDRVRTMFDESFVRAWRLYLAGSRAAFVEGWMQLFQVVFAPSGGTTIHWTRETLYTGDGRD